MFKKCKKVGFLHIPKTSGVSVINAFSSVLGADRCSTFHTSITEENFGEADFVSGHAFFGDIIAPCFLFTFLREPIEQLNSHLRWMDHLGSPERSEEFARLPQEIAFHVQQLTQIDFSSAVEIARFLQSVEGARLLKIRNVQAEMLAFSRASCRLLTDTALADLAITTLSKLSDYGLSETIDRDLIRIFSQLGLRRPSVRHLNPSPAARTIDISVPKIREALALHVQADLLLYDHAAELAAMRQSQAA